MPQGGLAALEAAKTDEDLLAIKAYQYDIVCNGVELSSGAIRNHLPEVMVKAFAIAGYDKAVLEAKFGGMLKALQYGAPPHGGIAPGIDRIVMLLAGATNLRDVIMFPMNQQAQDLLMGAPSRGHAPSSCASCTSAWRCRSARPERPGSTNGRQGHRTAGRPIIDSRWGRRERRPRATPAVAHPPSLRCGRAS